jgi:hypothetical protein
MASSDLPLASSKKNDSHITENRSRDPLITVSKNNPDQIGAVQID